MMKHCLRCDESKSELEFHWKIKDVKRQYTCKDCFKGIHAKWYQRNKRKASDRSKRLRNKSEDWLREQKNSPCMDCGNVFHPEAMDFDHVRGKKISVLASTARKGWGIHRIKEEIEKCDLVCSNCHRVRTYKRRVVRAV